MCCDVVRCTCLAEQRRYLRVPELRVVVIRWVLIMSRWLSAVVCLLLIVLWVRLVSPVLGLRMIMDLRAVLISVVRLVLSRLMVVVRGCGFVWVRLWM